MRRHGGERRQQGHRIEIGHVLRPALKRAELAVTHSNRIRDEHQIELAALGDLRDLGVVLEIGAGIDLRIGMQPGGDMVAGWVKKGPEMQFFAAAVVIHDLLQRCYGGRCKAETINQSLRRGRETERRVSTKSSGPERIERVVDRVQVVEMRRRREPHKGQRCLGKSEFSKSLVKASFLRRSSPCQLSAQRIELLEVKNFSSHQRESPFAQCSRVRGHADLTAA